MEITLKIEEKKQKFVGYIEKNNNKFFVKIEVSHGMTLPDVIVNIQGFYEGIGTITMMNNKNISIYEHRDNPNISIYTYESDYVICGDADEKKLLIKLISIYFKESDYFFVKDKPKIDYDINTQQFQLLQNRTNCILLETDEIIIEYTRHGGIKNNDFGEKIFVNPAYINIKFKKSIMLNNIFEELRKVECVLGFVFNRKMNLIDFSILSNNDRVYKLILPIQKDFKDIILSRTPVVDLTSLQLLKDILEKYYSDKHISSAINMYYEYLYSDLDNIFEFTSLINTIELIIASDFYITRVKKYNLEKNQKLSDNNKKMRELLKKLSTEEQKFIKEFYNEEFIELRDKIKFIFDEIFKLPLILNYEEYITLIVRTRNYYVHGTKYNKMLNAVDLVLTKKLFKNILYLLIVYASSNEENLLIDVYKESIPVVYNSLLKRCN